MFPTRMGARAGVQHRPTCSAAATTGTCFHGALPRCSPLCLHSQLGTRLPTYRGTARCMRLIAHVRNEPDQPSGQEAAPADRQAGRDTSSASPSSSGISPGPSSAPAPSPSSVTSASAAASDAQQQQPQQAPPEEVGPSGSAAPAASDTAAAPQQQGSSGSSPGRKRSRAGIKAQEILHHLQERPLPQISPALGAFLIAGAFCTAMVYVWARGSSVRRSNPYSFTMNFTMAGKVFLGTPLRMKGVQIGRVTEVSVEPTRVAVKAEVFDARNVVPRGSRFDINQLGLVPEAFLDITTPDGCNVAGAAGPHSPACPKQGLIVCHNSVVDGSQGSSMDYLMKVYLTHMSRNERMRPQLVEGERYTPAHQPASLDCPSSTSSPSA